jgi:hypothetical protein
MSVHWFQAVIRRSAIKVRNWPTATGGDSLLLPRSSGQNYPAIAINE